MIEFLFWSAVCIGFWYFLAHIDTYYEYKRKYIKDEYVKDYTFYRHTVEELQRALAGNKKRRG